MKDLFEAEFFKKNQNFISSYLKKEFEIESTTFIYKEVEDCIQK